MNGLGNLTTSLKNGDNEVFVDPVIGQRALKSLTRMLNFEPADRVPA